MLNRTELACVAIAVIAAGASLAERAWIVDPLHRIRGTQRLDADVIGSPGRPTLQALSIQHHLAAADLMWLAIVQELGQPASVMTEGHWDRVQRWTDIAVDLDPKYFVIYHSVGINLSLWAHRVDASDDILLRGQTALPQRWEFPMTLGYNAYFVRGDARLGSDYMAEAAAIPEAPKFLGSLAGRMRYHAGDEMGAIALLEEMMLHATGPAAEEIADRIKLLKGELRLRVYDEACERFRAATGRFPTSGAEVSDARLTAAPPVDYFDAPIVYDPQTCTARTSNTIVRETEAAKRVGGRSNDGVGITTSTSSAEP